MSENNIKFNVEVDFEDIIKNNDPDTLNQILYYVLKDFNNQFDAIDEKVFHLIFQNLSFDDCLEYYDDFDEILPKMTELVLDDIYRSFDACNLKPKTFLEDYFEYDDIAEVYLKNTDEDSIIELIKSQYNCIDDLLDSLKVKPEDLYPYIYKNFSNNDILSLIKSENNTINFDNIIKILKQKYIDHNKFNNEVLSQFSLHELCDHIKSKYSPTEINNNFCTRDIKKEYIKEKLKDISIEDLEEYINEKITEDE